MTASYREIGRRIVEFEQGGKNRAEYGQALLKHLSADLSARFGRGFRGLDRVHASVLQDLCTREHFRIADSEIAPRRTAEERAFHEAETLRGGWSVRQLDRQIGSQFHTRALLSRNKREMLEKGGQPQPGDLVTADEAIKAPYVLEFLDLKDEYSESELEDSLIHRLEDFLPELGSDFTFVGRQRRRRIDERWFRVDLLFFHRRLRCLVIIDLKLNALNHADAGRMHMYCNYAREHWRRGGSRVAVPRRTANESGRGARYSPPRRNGLRHSFPRGRRTIIR